ncbi:MAG: APC family permease [Candidatus Solibacter usitatus]|nr:APC family permease [Candidatus Solibacter usitatus]
MSSESAQSGGAVSPISQTTKVVVATTVALSFISFWRGAAIVLSDLASTMFYVGGITEQAIGKSAPYFVLAVMLFSFAVRSIYMESCSMFVRGGVYVVVRDSIGPNMAKLSVSALVVDYVLTGPISVVSAGQYLGHLLNEMSEIGHQSFRVDANSFAVFFSVAVTIYFWWENVKGIHESSGKALRIMQITTLMVVILLIWCGITLVLRGNWQLPPPPLPGNLTLDKTSLGWLHGTFWAQLPLVIIVVGFGHSLLAMSGFETLAQVYREIGYPKMRNLRITANIVCVYAVISTGLISLLAVMIIPDGIRKNYYDNLIGGLAMSLVGPELLRLVFHIFVVIVGVLILSGAVNTAIIGANGILNRVAEDGVLLDYFRKPHKRFGTTSRIINLIAILQISTLIISRGDLVWLGEAYAFGVVWSFFMKGLGVLFLRFQRKDQEYKTPLNFSLAGREIPVGLILSVLILFLTAVANLFTKQVATKAGITLTVILCGLFFFSEYINKRRAKAGSKGLENFNIEHEATVAESTLHARSGCILVAVRDFQRMEHLKKVLEKTNLRRHDIVVMTVRQLSTGAAEYGLREDQLFSDYEKQLFTQVVQHAEREGKPVELLVVPGVDPFDAMVQTANRLQASRLVSGVSARMTSDELARRIGLAWERLPEPRHPFSLEIISRDRPSAYVNLGPHPPRLWPEDLDRLHEIWLKLTEETEIGSKLHHRDVVGVALRRMEQELAGDDKTGVVQDIRREMRNSQ